MSAVDVLAFLPTATLARVIPTAQLASARSGRTAHLMTGDGTSACGRRLRGAIRHDLEGAEPPLLRVCTRCARSLPQSTRVHLATLGRPSAAELAAVREAEVLTAAAEFQALLEHHRTEAVMEDSVSEPVAFDGDPPPPLDYNGQRTDGVRLTLGLMIGALMPGAMTGGRVWIPGDASSPARVAAPGGAGTNVLSAPDRTGRFRPAGVASYAARRR